MTDIINEDVYVVFCRQQDHAILHKEFSFIRMRRSHLYSIGLNGAARLGLTFNAHDATIPLFVAKNISEDIKILLTLKGITYLIWKDNTLIDDYLKADLC